MIIWSIKLLNTAREAVAGRKYPHQLAWATAFGLLLGIVPHGNLLAVSLVVVVLSLKLNHAMAALTAIGTSFLVAAYVDPLAHRVGDTVLSHPEIQPLAMRAWEMPLMPWTDLNNTVVMGSFVIGVFALVPVFLVTYPLFRFFAPAPVDEPETSEAATESSPLHSEHSHQVVMIDRGHGQPGGPHDEKAKDLATSPPRKKAKSEISTNSSANETVAVETRIDVIRMKDHRSAVQADQNSADQQADGQPMDEALNYLLRQLRDSQQRSAA